jgi:hypothetical protein
MTGEPAQPAAASISDAASVSLIFDIIFRLLNGSLASCVSVLPVSDCLDGIVPGRDRCVGLVLSELGLGLQPGGEEVLHHLIPAEEQPNRDADDDQPRDNDSGLLDEPGIGIH